MTDPFAEVRENARRHWQDAPFALIQAKTDFDKLQRDADVLLAVVRAAERRREAQRHAKPIPQDYWDEAVLYWEQKEGEALAVLPEHLKRKDS